MLAATGTRPWSRARSEQPVRKDRAAFFLSGLTRTERPRRYSVLLPFSLDRTAILAEDEPETREAMDANLEDDKSLAAEVVRLRRENAELREKAGVRLGLVWERDALAPEDDLQRSFIPDLVLEEAGRPVSMLAEDRGNVIIEGNNLGALKILKRTHSGAFDCILIDPPYGTGNTSWYYNDAFVNPKHSFKDSGWLAWIEPRMALARDLLSPSGCIMVCIDDTKRGLLDLLMEQIMPGRRIGSMVWRTRQGANDKGIKNLSVDHEHVLIYGNTDFEFGGKPKSYDMYKFLDEGSDDPWRVSDLTVNVPWDSRRAGNGYYPIRNPATDIWYPCNPNAVWRFGSEKFLKAGKKNRKDTMEELIRKGRILFPRKGEYVIWESREDLDRAIACEDVPKNGKGVPLLRADLPGLDFFVGKRVGWGIPQFKRYKSDLAQTHQPLSSWIRSTADKEKITPEGVTAVTSGLTREGSSRLASLMGEKKFDYPKPVSLFMELLRQATAPDSLVLDFFAGSGTTGEAVLRLNSEDQGSRRFFLVSNTEATEKHPSRNLCRDVCAGRIRAAIDASKSDRDETSETIVDGFAYLRLSEYFAIDRADELTAQRAWSLILLRHGSPVVPWQPVDGVCLSASADGKRFGLVPSPTEKAVERLRADGDEDLILYTPFPSRLRPLLADRQVEVIDIAVLEPV